MVALLCEYTKNTKLYTFKWQNYVICKLYLSKAVTHPPQKKSTDTNSILTVNSAFQNSPGKPLQQRVHISSTEPKSERTEQEGYQQSKGSQTLGEQSMDYPLGHGGQVLSPVLSKEGS